MNGTNGTNGTNGANGTGGIDGGFTPAPEGERGLQPPVPGAMLIPSSNTDESRILAAVDRLRELGIDRTHPLPQIIVCGAQSVGKSSVLESIVQVPFPRGMGMCTRYVTKVTMERAKTRSIEVRILPGPNRSPAEAVSTFRRRDDSENCAARLGGFMEEAHRLIFPFGHSTDRTRVFGVRLASSSKAQVIAQRIVLAKATPGTASDNPQPRTVVGRSLTRGRWARAGRSSRRGLACPSSHQSISRDSRRVCPHRSCGHLRS